MPGMAALSNKGLLVASMTAAYGEGAFAVIPRSYVLPDQYWRWRAWLKAQVELKPAKRRFANIRFFCDSTRFLCRYRTSLRSLATQTPSAISPTKQAVRPHL